jgi:hypothetical protein
MQIKSLQPIHRGHRQSSLIWLLELEILEHDSFLLYKLENKIGKWQEASST